MPRQTVDSDVVWRQIQRLGKLLLEGYPVPLDLFDDCELEIAAALGVLVDGVVVCAGAAEGEGEVCLLALSWEGLWWGWGGFLGLAGSCGKELSEEGREGWLLPEEAGGEEGWSKHCDVVEVLFLVRHTRGGDSGGRVKQGQRTGLWWWSSSQVAVVLMLSRSSLRDCCIEKWSVLGGTNGRRLPATVWRGHRHGGGMSKQKLEAHRPHLFPMRVAHWRSIALCNF